MPPSSWRPFGITLEEGCSHFGEAPPLSRAASAPLRISGIVLAPDAPDASRRFELHVGQDTSYLLEVRHATRQLARADAMSRNDQTCVVCLPFLRGVCAGVVGVCTIS